MHHLHKLARTIIMQALWLDGFVLLVYGACLAVTGYRPQLPDIAVIIAVITGHWLHLYAMRRFCVEPAGILADRFERAIDHFDNQLEYDSELEAHGARLDPWSYQRKLMEASGQELPSAPTLSKGSMLYGALILEESGETMKGLAKALMNQIKATGKSQLVDLSLTFDSVGDELLDFATKIRTDLANMEIESSALTEADAVELLDGTTDIAVVNCGFALACGLPGGDAYAEVGLSNLSKVNPETGVIDKTPDGKWIKGASFFRPDLAKILRQHAPITAELGDEFFVDSDLAPPHHSV